MFSLQKVVESCTLEYLRSNMTIFHLDLSQKKGEHFYNPQKPEI